MAGDWNLDVVHVDILQKQNSLLTDPEVISLVQAWLNSHSTEELEDDITEFDDLHLNEHISSINIQDRSIITKGNFYELCYHVYRFNSSSPEMQVAEEGQPMSTQWLLPTQDFHGIWETLIYDGDIKNEVLDYILAVLHLSEKKMNPNIIPSNRVVLLHGPPGCGKTSLCKALAQKLSIRLNSQFQYGYFIEVKSQSLFSKWFSETGKLITKMFQDIITLLEDSKALVIVQLDEVESLVHSRATSLHGNEPSDALRAVNTLLTHLDTIKRYPNVLIFTTSNITGAIDLAFVDRADVNEYIGLPCVDAIYQIYCSGIKELLKGGVITGGYRRSEWLYSSVKALGEATEKLKVTRNMEKFVSRTTKLHLIAEQSVGLSGRSLRKVPVMACSFILKKKNVITVEDFLDALSKAVQKSWNDIKKLNIDS